MRPKLAQTEQVRFPGMPAADPIAVKDALEYITVELDATAAARNGSITTQERDAYCRKSADA
jgi:hypothetical protein